MQTILPVRLVDLGRIGEEAAIMEDLVEISDEGTAVSKVQEFPFEVADEALHLGNPFLAVAADAVQLPLRRQAEALLDLGEFLGPSSASLHEFVDASFRRVHQGRGGTINQVAGGEQVGPASRESLPIEDAEDRAEDVVALHVR